MDQRGLIVQGRLDLDHEPAVELYAAMKSGRINGLSFAYDNLSKRILDNGVTELLELELLEITICIIPMNANAHVLAIKSAPARPPVEESDLEHINRELDQLASNERPRDPAIAKQVDELILATRRSSSRKRSTERSKRRGRTGCASTWFEPVGRIRGRRPRGATWYRLRRR